MSAPNKFDTYDGKPMTYPEAFGRCVGFALGAREFNLVTKEDLIRRILEINDYMESQNRSMTPAPVPPNENP